MKLFLLPLLASSLVGQNYKVENIPLPANCPPEVGGIDFAPDGTLYTVLRRGDVFRAMPKTDSTDFDWQLFATGFHNGCGIDAVSRDQVHISQMAELTQATDTDADGTADQYRAIAKGWGLSGNYHETNSLTPDGQGGYYLAIGTASHNGPTGEYTLGDYSKFGRRGRNFSAVLWRGWVLHCDAKGQLSPFASGFRMHNGINLDDRGLLWCGDNQGDWRATTPFYHVEKGKFYGHPSSLVWDENWPKDKDPLATFREDLDAYNEHRTYAAIQLPHGEMNRSAGEPIRIPETFPHFKGQMLLPDNNGNRISRLMLEKVNGKWQGACTHFLTDNGLRSGNHRIRFSPDGQHIYVGQTVRGWGTPAEGLQRIIPIYKNEPFDIEKFQITKEGFKLTFTQPLPEEAIEQAAWKFKSFTYQSKWTYGSPAENELLHPLKDMRVWDEYTVEITLENFTTAPALVYELRLPEWTSTEGGKLQNRLFYYTANQRPE